MTWQKWKETLNDFKDWMEKEYPHIPKRLLRWWGHLKKDYYREIKKHNGLLLDVGCGDGTDLEAVNGGVGIDPIIGKISIQAVGEYIPFKDKCFSRCTMNSTLDHLQDPHKTLNEIHRILKDKGIFILLQSVVTKKHNPSETHLHQFTVADLDVLTKKFVVTQQNGYRYSPSPLYRLYDWYGSRVRIPPNVLIMTCQKRG